MRICRISLPLLPLFAILTVWGSPAKAEQTVDDISVADTRIPRYELIPPNWSVEISFSPLPWNGQTISSVQSNTIYGLLFQFEYQPDLFQQKYGILGIGPSLAIYPSSSWIAGIPNLISGGNPQGPALLMGSLGGQIRYQARYFRNQPLVPEGGYEAAALYSSFPGGTNGVTFAQGPFAGIWLLLNILEPSVAAEAFTDDAILRTYLVAEAHFLSGSSANASVSGQSYYFGIRFEF